MAYIVNRTNGSTLAVINDFNIDNTSSPLTLIGKGYKDWGEVLNENLVKLLENFANNTPPTNPLNGQLWYDTSQNSLKVYNSTLSSWQSLQVSINGLSFYSQQFTSPTSGQVTGFINDNEIVALFSNINVSADNLDNGTLFPAVNAQGEFPRGIAPGLNLGNTNSKIYGQDILTIGTIKVNGVNNIIEINLSGDTIVNNDFESRRMSKLHSVFVSGTDINNPNYYLPVSSGTLGQVLVSQGNNNVLIWEDPLTLIAKDKIEGFGGPNYVQIKASAPSQGIEMFTENKFRLIVDTDGNIGIDASAPSYKVELRPNVSSNNVSIGLVNDNPLLKTSIDLVPEFNSGNSANVNFIRRGNLGSPITPTETLGSISWLGRNNSNEDQDVARIRSVVVTAHTSTIQGNLEFMIADVSGELYKTLEIDEGGNLIVYYNEGANYYILPSSAGKVGQYLVSNSANNRLQWKYIPNYEVFVSSYDVTLLPFPTRVMIISGISENTGYVIYIKSLNLGIGPFTGMMITGKVDGLPVSADIHGVRGHGLFSGREASLNVVSAYSVSAGILFNSSNIEANKDYDGRIVIEVLSGKKLKVAGELVAVNCSTKFTFTASNFVTSFDHIEVRIPSNSTVTGTYDLYRIENMIHPSLRI